MLEIRIIYLHQSFGAVAAVAAHRPMENDVWCSLFPSLSLFSSRFKSVLAACFYWSVNNMAGFSRMWNGTHNYHGKMTRLQAFHFSSERKNCAMFTMHWMPSVSMCIVHSATNVLKFATPQNMVHYYLSENNAFAWV